MTTIEPVSETPTMAKAGDITSLLGSKRKRSSDSKCSSKPILKPVLRGSFMRHQNKVTWSGCWGLTKENFKSEFSDSVVKAPFYFERKSLASENSVENGQLVQDGYFSGFFCMQDLSRPTLNCTYKKFYEKEVLLRFVKTDSDFEYDVLGSGQNKFGRYLIEGKFYVNTNEIHCARNYLPNLKKANSPTKRRAKSTVTPVCKRSSRIRTPSAKYMESFGLSERKNQLTSHGFEFPGKDDIQKLISKFLEKHKSQQITKILVDLRKKRIRSLKTALKQLYEISFVVKDVYGQAELQNGLRLLQEKYDVKLSRKRPLSTKSDDEPTSCSDGYISLFENVKNIQEIDPLGLNLTCRLPERLRSPALTGMVDLSKTFQNIEARPESPDGGHIKPFFSSEIEDVCSMEIEDIDFSDLSTLDAETIKELNAFVEFSCPSKGS